MRCFNHANSEAVGLCMACGRGVCGECVVDLERGLACRGPCEAEARRLLDLRDFSFSQPHHFIDRVKNRRSQTMIAGLLSAAIGLAFMVAWYIFGEFLLGVIGAFPLVIGLLSLPWARSKTRTDQFRLCPHCGFNLSGATTHKCPECGQFV